ncbi:MAG: DEAD/DEAH box helicase, partial [Nocardioidaceae bacterium]|nr:DEAD/DEAH box helicase [Nocardioidaceae bacterium]
ELDAQQPDLGALIPLALEFRTRPASAGYRSLGETIHLRPMRQGRNKPWIKSGAAWSDIGSTTRNSPHAQVDALTALHAHLAGHQQYYAPGSEPSLAHFGPHLVRSLRRARDVGVTLLGTGALRTIEIADQMASVRVELHPAAQAAGIVVHGVVVLDGVVWPGESVQAIGNPATAVGLRGPDGLLVLADLDATMPLAVRHFLDAPPLSVPPGELADFRAELPLLMRHLAVDAGSSGIDLPEPLSPTLLLTLTWESATTADLAWTWHYGDRSCALDSHDRLGGLRDAVAEQTVLAQVPTSLTRSATITDADALRLAIEELPRLRALEDVDVLERERPDFRETRESPEISFDLTSDESSSSGTDWFDLAVSISVAGESIALRDVLAALTLQQEFLVLPSGLYVSTDQPEFDRLREVVLAAGELRERDGETISIGHHDLGLWAQLAEAGVVDHQVADWVRRAQALCDLTEIGRPEPGDLSTELRNYQREGFWWLAFLWAHGLGGILADDMGLGKTLQVLALITHARSVRPEESPFLIVAPTSVVTAWCSEAARHAPDLRVGVVARRTDDVAAIASESDLVLTTYTLARLAHDQYQSVKWAGLVLDEAQQVKNHQSKTYSAVRTIEAPFRLAVTGTPFENHLLELWALLSLTVPGLYPWPRAFTEKVVRPVERHGDREVLDRFRARIRPFMLRRTKELVAQDLPEKQEQVLAVELTSAHRRIYETHLARERQRILGLVEDFDRNRVAIFSALTTLRQLALDPALIDDDHEAVGSAKLDVLVDHLAELTAEGHRALVFSQFTGFLTRVRNRLDAAKITSSYLDGSTRNRAAVIEDFRAGVAPVFLISLKAGGVGLTLTEADYVFVLDPWWNPAAEAQAVDRAHRIGQRHHVHVYRLVASDTIEEKVMDLKTRKAELFAQVIDGDAAFGTSIGAEDIRNLFG